MAKVFVLNKSKTQRPIDLWNEAGEAVTIVPGVIVAIDSSFAINLPKDVVKVEERK